MQEPEESPVQTRNKLYKEMSPDLAELILQAFKRNETEGFTVEDLKICCQKYTDKKGVCKRQEEIIDKLNDTTKELLEKLLKSDSFAAYHLREVCESYLKDRQLEQPGDER